MDAEILHDYAINYQIGEGGFAKVFLGVHKASNLRVAIKMISKEMETEEKHMYYIKNEIELLKSFKNPFCCRLLDVVESRKNIYIVLEYLCNGSLLDKVNRDGPINESQAVHLFAQLLYVIKYLHKERHIIHRDLKLENILFDENFNLRLIDFGFSKCLQENNILATRCGSLLYCAPELIKGLDYSYDIDIWSLGIILFVLVAGFYPFDDQNITVLAQRIIYADFTCPKHFSNELEELVRKMLEKDPADRISLEEIIEHPWVKDAYISLESRVSKFNIPEEYIESEIHRLISLGATGNEVVLRNIIESALICDRLFEQLTDSPKKVKHHKSYPVITKPDMRSDIPHHNFPPRYKKICITLPLNKNRARRTPQAMRQCILPMN